MRFGEAGVVELSTLIGYFVMVSWIMNVARTPSQTSRRGNTAPGPPNLAECVRRDGIELLLGVHATPRGARASTTVWMSTTAVS